MKLAMKHPALAFVLAALVCPAIAQSSSQTATPTPARTIVIHAKKFAFVPSEITLKVNQTVKLELTSDDVEHSLAVPALKIDGIMKKGEVADVIVTPTETGDFKGRCGIYCGRGHRDMRFTVHVVN